ncbi:hypothetical protein [Alcanivorax sp.]|uniref:hypothetical protein n=1 Tax=Alcanivorax sp. TaxID=1872427 RepID=UPI0039E60F48
MLVALERKLNMVGLANVFSLLALLGFIASLAAHIAGYAGIERPFGINPWPLHVGIFVVWFPAVLASMKLSKGFPQKDMWKAALRGCQKWMRHALYGLFGYAFLSFFAFFVLAGDGENEASTVRGFSGHWLIFYFAAFAILRSYVSVSRSDTIRRCKYLHVVEPAHAHCPECGEYVGRQY